MEVVSGAIGYEKIHYLAVPQKRIETDMAKLLEWCNSSDENICVKSALAHLYFVGIHPYDDGNGRIARAITDYLLSSFSKTTFKFYSFSTAVNSDRKGYMEMALENIEVVVKKTKFWDKCRDKGLNTRQLKVLIKMLNKGKESFEGGLNTKKYMAITKTSRATAIRDIGALVEYGFTVCWYSFLKSNPIKILNIKLKI